MISCKLTGCIQNKAYAVLKVKKVYRITFSKSLAVIIANEINGIVKRCLIMLGKPIGVYDSSNLYAVCKKKSLWPLRITFFKDMAELWRNDSTEILDCKIKLINE